MNKKIIPYIYILFWSNFSHGIFGQNIELYLTAKDSIQSVILTNIPHIKKHYLKEGLYQELEVVKTKLQKIGFFIVKIDTIISVRNKYTAILNLGEKTDKIIVLIPKEIKYKNQRIKTDSISLKPEKFENFTNQILAGLDKKGQSFSEIKFTNPLYDKNTLILQLEINESRKRKIDKVVIKGYENFPKNFVRNFFKIKPQTIFSKDKVEEVSKLTKSLNFIEEKKKPQILFKKDSTQLYLYIDKKEASSFDGIINLASKDNDKGLLLNGNLDLKLSNVFNSGEYFELFWNKVASEKSEFKISTNIPYIANTSISTKIDFNLFRLDSTFLNTSFSVSTSRDLTSNSKISISYSSEKSTYLLNTEQDNLDSYSNYFVGAGYRVRKASKNNLFKNKYDVSFNTRLGKRRSPLKDENQLKIKVLFITNIKTSQKSYVHIKSESGILRSDNYLTNELFRIGGANSIRVVNEQSLFTNKYSYVNIEYRFLTSLSSYLYSITDLGFYNNTFANKLNNLIGLGVGYQFKLNKNYINLGYVIGLNNNNINKFNNSKLIIKLTSLF